MIFAIFMILRLHDMVAIIDIPKGTFMILGGGAQPRMRESQKTGFKVKIHEVNDLRHFLHTSTQICDFPHYGVKGTSKTTNIPLGI